MNKNNYSQIAQNKQYGESIRSLVDSMVFEEDPKELDAYRKLIRKHVSVFRRTYLAGYLFKLSREGGRVHRTNGRRRGAPDRVRSEGRRAQSRATKNTSRSSSRSRQETSVPEGMVSLHINCGRMHGMNETELRALIDREASPAATASITHISLHDKYLFLYIAKEHASAVINGVTGVSLLNRNLLASYSRRHESQGA